MHSLFGVIYMQFDQVSLFLILWVLIIDRYRLLPESQKKTPDLEEVNGRVV